MKKSWILFLFLIITSLFLTSQTYALSTCATTFTDLNTADTSLVAATGCLNQNYCVVRGNQTTLAAGTQITRQEAVALIARYHIEVLKDWAQSTNPNSYWTDFPNTDSTIFYPVQTAKEHGFINGYQDGTLNPTGLWLFGFHGFSKTDTFNNIPYDFAHEGAPITRGEFMKDMYSLGKAWGQLNACQVYSCGNQCSTFYGCATTGSFQSSTSDCKTPIQDPVYTPNQSCGYQGKGDDSRCVATQHDPVGYFDAADGNGLKGWACDIDALNAQLAVHFYIDGPAGSGAFLLATNTNVDRPDTAGMCGGTTMHGFQVPLDQIPAQYKNGQPHQIYAYAINQGGGTTNPVLGYSPRTFTYQQITNCPARCSNSMGCTRVEAFQVTNGDCDNSPAPLNPPTYTAVDPSVCGPKGGAYGGNDNNCPVAPTGSITASPNPCTIAPGKTTCSSTISWTTAHASNVQIRLGSQVLSSDANGSLTTGSVEAGDYHFELYTGSTKLGEVVVSGHYDNNADWTTCPALSNTTGSSTLVYTPQATGTYKVWTRMMAGSSTANTFYLQVGDQCKIVVGGGNISTSSWQWTNTTSSGTPITVNMVAGRNYSVQLVGIQSGVKVDEVKFDNSSCAMLEGADGHCAPVTASGTIEGYRILPDGSRNSTIDAQVVTLDGTKTSGFQPHQFTTVPFPANGTHTVSVPALSGYDIQALVCYNGQINKCNDAGGQTTVKGNSVTIDNNKVIPTGHVDLYWIYTQVQSPKAQVSGPTTATVGTPVTFNAVADDTAQALNKIGIYNLNSAAGSSWAIIQEVPCSAAHCTLSANWTPTAPGTYTIVVNAYAPSGLPCSGNPALAPNGDGVNWAYCGGGSNFTITVNPAATPTPKPVVPTPTPTTILVPTNTPVPTSTPVPNATLLTLKVILHAIGVGGDNANPNGGGGNPTPIHPQRTLSVSLYDNQNKLVLTKSGPITYLSATDPLTITGLHGAFNGQIDLGTNFTTGDYTVLIKTDSYLAKRFSTQIHITKGTTTDTSAITLVTGDIDNNNKLDLFDYQALSSCYGDIVAPDPAKCSATQKLAADLNDDGKVNQIDINYFIRELSVQSGGDSPTQ